MRPFNHARAAALAALAAAALTAGAGCSKGEEAKPTPAMTAPTPSPTPSAAPKVEPSATASAKPAAPKVELTIASVGNTMGYDKPTLTVPTGAEVHLVIKNNATMATLPHNWVLVKTGTEAKVAAAGLTKGEAAGYVDVRDTNILAFTPEAKPGETAEVTFTAPAAGTYPYICTTPGHYLMMKGVLTVTP